MIFELNNIPIPPSSNSSYATIIRNGRMIRIKARDLNNFENEFVSWSFKKETKEVIQNILDYKTTLKEPVVKIDCIFYFEKSRIITKLGRAKKLDCSNRLKHLHDCIAKLIQIDDCNFFEGTFEKLIAKKQEHVRVFLQVTELDLEKITEL